MTDTLESTHADSDVTVAGEPLKLLRGGSGEPVLVLHHDIGNPGWLPFHQRLAKRFDVLAPSHPGYDQSARPAWLRSVRDIACIYQWLLADLNLSQVTLVGLGLGGWIAAEMAAMAPRDFRRLVLVGAMGLQPTEGQILDQALVNYIEYARAGFRDPSAFEAIYGTAPSTDQLEAWDINREMTFRIAWKPYLHSQTLPHLLGGVRAPALVVWGADDRIVPLSCAHQYVQALPQARLEVIPNCGHCVEMERPDDLARLIEQFIAS
ncbi:MAG: alpha/beta fold hydrolase [Chloroflexota bacterium]